MYVLLLFLDGVGLGEANPAVNPFVTAQTPHLTALFGPEWYTAGRGPLITDKASLVPTDANLGVDGRPQSATGQAVILTGKNVPALIGEHYGPKPNQAVREIVEQGSLFSEVVQKGLKAGLLTPYPAGYFAAINSGKRLYSTVPLAATQAGVPLLTVDELRAGQALSPDFTGRGWLEALGYTDIPLYEPFAAGQKLATLAQQYHFSFFEHWPSDEYGHRGTMEEAQKHIELLDEVIGGVLASWSAGDGFLIITSDHGNLEDKSQRQHTRAPVPTLLAGPQHHHWAQQINSLLDIAPLVRNLLSL